MTLPDSSITFIKSAALGKGYLQLGLIDSLERVEYASIEDRGVPASMPPVCDNLQRRHQSIPMLKALTLKAMAD